MNVGDVVRLEIATGNDPLAALVSAVSGYASGGTVVDVGIAHDDGCPCESGERGMPACTCELVHLTITRLA